MPITFAFEYFLCSRRQSFGSTAFCVFNEIAWNSVNIGRDVLSCFAFAHTNTRSCSFGT